MKFAPSETAIVGIGGCIGSLVRYQVNEWIPSLSGTFMVNVLGCVAIGILMYESIYFGAFSRNSRLLLGAGMIGSFTTFSAFATQSIQAGPALGILLIMGISSVVCLGSCSAAISSFGGGHHGTLDPGWPRRGIRLHAPV